MFCEIPVFGRCCFCMPLRRGILTFGYLNILFAAFMVGVYSYSVHHSYYMTMVFHGVASDIDSELGVAIYCADIIFSVVLLYGAHRQIIIYLKVFYYYTLCTLFATVLLEVIACTQRYFYLELELLPLFFAGLAIHVYLIFLVRSLLKKLEISGHTYENQLHQIVNGETVKEASTVYPSTVVPVENA
ncbi:uncharacterized protein LOC120631505 [Pararge aegeria]|uniref:Jg15337 protein n=1 Tax=Pararge aegeria aegeria TaxID=348720 RepID=A0A8S4RIB4_9NEOP|nr:uncharacterized protein LOC120631505 [Pararge aegeria]CAH2236578.1 jg15337 [Pararge aegeria aegeria]